MDSNDSFVRKPDAEAQLRELREQVETLMRDRVTPMVTDAVGRAGQTMRQVSDTVTDKTDAVVNQVKQNPLTAIAIAIATGFLIGRITR